jgi:hypothetical protein
MARYVAIVIHTASIIRRPADANTRLKQLTATRPARPHTTADVDPHAPVTTVGAV